MIGVPCRRARSAVRPERARRRSGRGCQGEPAPATEARTIGPLAPPPQLLASQRGRHESQGESGVGTIAGLGDQAFDAQRSAGDETRHRAVAVDLPEGRLRHVRLDGRREEQLTGCETDDRLEVAQHRHVLRLRIVHGRIVAEGLKPAPIAPTRPTHTAWRQPTPDPRTSRRSTVEMELSFVASYRGGAAHTLKRWWRCCCMPNGAPPQPDERCGVRRRRSRELGFSLPVYRSYRTSSSALG